jgi:hypothetical protein
MDSELTKFKRFVAAVYLLRQYICCCGSRLYWGDGEKERYTPFVNLGRSSICQPHPPSTQLGFHRLAYF